MPEILSFLCHVTIWTDWRQIIDAWKAGELVLRRNQLRLEAFDNPGPREHRIMNWLIAELGICGSDQQLERELQQILQPSMQDATDIDPAGQADALKQIRAAHGAFAHIKSD